MQQHGPHNKKVFSQIKYIFHVVTQPALKNHKTFFCVQQAEIHFAIPNKETQSIFIRHAHYGGLAVIFLVLHNHLYTQLAFVFHLQIDFYIVRNNSDDFCFFLLLKNISNVLFFFFRRTLISFTSLFKPFSVFFLCFLIMSSKYFCIGKNYTKKCLIGFIGFENDFTIMTLLIVYTMCIFAAYTIYKIISRYFELLKIT